MRSLRIITRPRDGTAITSSSVPGIDAWSRRRLNYRLADLLFENKDFGEAAKQYERARPTNTRQTLNRQPRSYATVYAYREQLKAVAAKESL